MFFGVPTSKIERSNINPPVPQDHDATLDARTPLFKSIIYLFNYFDTKVSRNAVRMARSNKAYTPYVTDNNRPGRLQHHRSRTGRTTAGQRPDWRAALPGPRKSLAREQYGGCTSIEPHVVAYPIPCTSTRDRTGL